MKPFNVYIMGDIHGDWKIIRDFYKRNQKLLDNQNNALILLGDAGLNYFFSARDEKAKKQLGKFPFTYFIIRGNHEERPSTCSIKNPEKWTLEDFWGGKTYVEKEYPYIKYAEDKPSIYNIPTDLTTYKTLVLPGAYSVDKDYRLKMGYSWFEGEQLTEEEKKYGKELIKDNPAFDLILSHTCPKRFEPTDLFLPFIDQTKVDKNMEIYLDEIESVVEYSAWIWGHFHSNRFYEGENNKQLMLFQKAINLNHFMENSFLRKECL